MLRILHLKNKFKTAQYRFNKEDTSLYSAECLASLPPVEVLKSGKDHSFLRIGKMEFYWPNTFTTQDLPWLYHEVFDLWETNPSSYDNPRLSHRDQLDWVIDAGAGEGFYSLFIIEGFRGKLLAVEPLSSFRESLLLTLNNKVKSGGSFEVITKALGSEPSKGTIVINPNNICNTKVKQTTSANCVNNEIVEITTIDICVSQYRLEGKGLIKMDIEGCEIGGLKGAEKTIRKLKPDLAIAVYHDHENAWKCREIVKSFREDYKIEFRGMYAYFEPPRPYMMFAY